MLTRLLERELEPLLDSDEDTTRAPLQALTPRGEGPIKLLERSEICLVRAGDGGVRGGGEPPVRVQGACGGPPLDAYTLESDLCDGGGHPGARRDLRVIVDQPRLLLTEQNPRGPTLPTVLNQAANVFIPFFVGVWLILNIFCAFY